MDDYTNYHYFQAVAQTGSFSAASIKFGQTPSAVSRRISRLEDRLGKKLLVRTTRTLHLTPEGETYLAFCKNLIKQMDQADEQVRQIGPNLVGTIKIAAISAYASRGLALKLKGFANLHPDLKIELCSVEPDYNHASNAPDVEILSLNNRPKPENDHYVQLEPNPWIICATRKYLDQHGTPDTPEDLLSHNCLQLSSAYSSRSTWKFQINQKIHQIKITGNFQGHGEAIYGALMADMGISRLASFLVNKDIESGNLIKLLDEYMPHSERAIYARPLNTDHISHKAKVFLKYLQDSQV